MTKISETITVTASSEAELTFEAAVQRLETIVQRLESGEVALDESLQLFEEGIKLTRYCTGKLDAAEGKLQILLGFNGAEPQIGDFRLPKEDN
ncbi:MAG: exodeoxyribonuclease VII small subunit [Bacillota bacterium]|jgi:exodeoxyribonuclease VII small subunit